jgi:hypothetical protein
MSSLNCSFGSNAARKHNVYHRDASAPLLNAFLRASRNPWRTSGQSSYNQTCAFSVRCTCGNKETRLKDFEVNIDS